MVLLMNGINQAIAFSPPNRIPRRIVQIYSVAENQPHELPLICRVSVTNVRILHPSFEHVLFDRFRIDSFMEREFPQYKVIFDSFQFPIQRFDLFRYLAVYRLGGFYLDLDILLTRSLEPLLECYCVFAFEEVTISSFLRDEHNMDWELANYGFGAIAGEPFVGAVIDSCIRGVEEPLWSVKAMSGIPRWFREQFFVPISTGPGMVSRTFSESHEFRRNMTVLFPTNVLNLSTCQQFGSFGVHLMQSSWRRRFGLIRVRFARIWEINRRKIFMKRSFALGSRRIGDWSHFSK